MSIDTCNKCGDLIDTDYFPEVYREDWDWACICDCCYNDLEPEERKDDDQKSDLPSNG